MLSLCCGGCCWQSYEMQNEKRHLGDNNPIESIPFTQMGSQQTMGLAFWATHCQLSKLSPKFPFSMSWWWWWWWWKGNPGDWHALDMFGLFIQWQSKSSQGPAISHCLCVCLYPYHHQHTSSVWVSAANQTKARDEPIRFDNTGKTRAGTNPIERILCRSSTKTFWVLHRNVLASNGLI